VVCGVVKTTSELHAQPLPPPQPADLFAEIRCQGPSRRAAFLLAESKRWRFLQRASLARALRRIASQRTGTRREVRLWRADALRVIADSHDGVSDTSLSTRQRTAYHCCGGSGVRTSGLIFENLRDGQKLPFFDKPDRCFKANAPSSIHRNVDREFERLMRLGYLEARASRAPSRAAQGASRP
jgi:hypothetical protein